jgi:hypothetical protein
MFISQHFAFPVVKGIPSVNTASDQEANGPQVRSRRQNLWEKHIRQRESPQRYIGISIRPVCMPRRHRDSIYSSFRIFSVLKNMYLNPIAVSKTALPGCGVDHVRLHHEQTDYALSRPPFPGLRHPLLRTLSTPCARSSIASFSPRESPSNYPQIPTTILNLMTRALYTSRYTEV